MNQELSHVGKSRIIFATSTSKCSHSNNNRDRKFHSTAFFPRYISVCQNILILIIVFEIFGVTTAYRYTDANNQSNDPKFEAYAPGFVGQYGVTTNPQRTRVNQGAGNSVTKSVLYDGVHPRQNCPEMVGPVNGQYFCRGKEFGYCDRRSGSCFCETGYQGNSCGECAPHYYRDTTNKVTCHPKKSCPLDCSGAGDCDYTTGLCSCYEGFVDVNCSKHICSTHGTLCTECTSSVCTECIEGHYVAPPTSPDAGDCLPCSTFDPRCLRCDHIGCLECADPILRSIHRSGYRQRDFPLPFDEVVRELPITLPFGSKHTDAFAGAETYRVPKRGVAATTYPLKTTSQTCTQGTQEDHLWECTESAISHMVCGHEGVITFSSPTYEISETAGYIPLTVRRSGGGYGSVRVVYSIEHITTNSSDITPTAFYTGSQILDFTEGVVELTFRVTINDDSELEGNERFLVRLYNLHDDPGLYSSNTSGHSSLAQIGPQGRAIITILDDEDVAVNPPKCTVEGAGTISATVGVESHVRITAFDSTEQLTGQLASNEIFFIELNVPYGSAQDQSDSVPWHSGRQFPPLDVLRDTVTGNPTFPCVFDSAGQYDCKYLPKRAGNYDLSVMLAKKDGLRGEYFDNPWLEGPAVVDRIDRTLNFNWTGDRITPNSKDFVSARWTGKLYVPLVTIEDYHFYVTADDNVRVWLDHILLIDMWDTPCTTTIERVVAMEFGFHDFRVEYRDITGDAFLRIELSSSSLARSVLQPYRLWSLHSLGSGVRVGNVAGASPYQITIAPGPLVGPSSRAIGGALSEQYAGNAHEFVILSNDIYGNHRGMLGASDSFSIIAVLVGQGGGGDGSQFVKGSYKFLTTDPPEDSVGAKGDHVASITIPISGKYDLYVSAADPSGRLKGIEGSPFELRVWPGVTRGATSNAWGVGLSQATAGITATFTVRLRDHVHNRKFEGNERVRVFAYHVDSGVYHRGWVYDQGNGKYDCAYVAEKRGVYSLHVVVDVPPGTASSFAARKVAGNIGSYENYSPEHIAQSPYTVNVAPNVLHEKSTATGVGISTATSGVVQTFEVQGRDLHSNAILEPSNSDVVTVEIAKDDATLVTGNVVYTTDGKYTCSYDAPSSGKRLLYVKTNDVNIVGSPFTVDVSDGVPVSSTSTASGIGLSDAQAGFEQTFLVQLRDTWGNKRSSSTDTIGITLTHLGNARWKAGTVDSSNGGIVTGNAEYLQDGLWMIKYTATRAGLHTIDVTVTISDVPVGVSGSPFSLTVRPAPTNPGKSEPTGIGLFHGVAGVASPVKVQAVDKFGNTQITSGDQFFVRCHAGPDEGGECSGAGAGALLEKQCGICVAQSSSEVKRQSTAKAQDSLVYYAATPPGKSPKAGGSGYCSSEDACRAVKNRTTATACENVPGCVWEAATDEAGRPFESGSGGYPFSNEVCRAALSETECNAASGVWHSVGNEPPEGQTQVGVASTGGIWNAASKDVQQHYETIVQSGAFAYGPSIKTECEVLGLCTDPVDILGVTPQNDCNGHGAVWTSNKWVPGTWTVATPYQTNGNSGNSPRIARPDAPSNTEVDPTDGYSPSKGISEGWPMRGYAGRTPAEEDGLVYTLGSQLSMYARASQTSRSCVDTNLGSCDVPEILLSNLGDSTGKYEGTWTPQVQGDYECDVVMASPGGLYGEYFDVEDLGAPKPGISKNGESRLSYNDSGNPTSLRNPNSSQSGLVHSQIDPVIDFAWEKSPHFDILPGLENIIGWDRFSIRWSGFIQPLFSELYTLTVHIGSDDGIRIFIDDLLVIDSWSKNSLWSNTNNEERIQGTGSSVMRSSTNVLLTAAKLHKIIIEYRDLTGIAAVKLQWRSASQQVQVVPASQLYSEAPLLGSPFRPTIESAQTDPRKSFAKGSGIVVATAAIETKFVIDARDAFGNHRHIGADKWTVVATLTGGGRPDLIANTCKGTSKATCDKGYDSHQCTLDTSCEWKSDTLVDGSRPCVGAECCSAIPCSADIFQNNKNRCNSAPGCAFTDAGPYGNNSTWKRWDSRFGGGGSGDGADENASFIASVEDTNDGFYTVRYTPKLSGLYQLHITMDDSSISATSKTILAAQGKFAIDEFARSGTRHIQGSPFLLVVSDGQARGSLSTASGDGISRAMTGVEYTFTVTLRDINGNERLVEDQLTVLLKHSTGWQQVKGVTTYLGAGKYNVAYTAQKSGVYSMNISVATENGEENISKSPFSLYVEPNAASGSGSTVTGGALTTVQAGTLASFKIYAGDANSRFPSTLPHGEQENSTNAVNQRTSEQEKDVFAVRISGVHVYNLWAKPSPIIDPNGQSCSDGHCRPGGGEYIVQWNVRVPNESSPNSSSNPHLISITLARDPGLLAEYFSNAFFQGSPTKISLEPNIDHDWQFSPLLYADGSGLLNYVSIRWKGLVRAEYDADYIFSATIREGDHMRVRIDSVWVLNNWPVAMIDDGSNGGSLDDNISSNGTLEPLVEISGSAIHLNEGALYDIYVEYRDNRGAATAQLSWMAGTAKKNRDSLSGIVLPKEIVPNRLLWSREENIVGSPFTTSVTPASP